MTRACGSCHLQLSSTAGTTLRLRSLLPNRVCFAAGDLASTAASSPEAWGSGGCAGAERPPVAVFDLLLPRRLPSAWWWISAGCCWRWRARTGPAVQEPLPRRASAWAFLAGCWRRWRCWLLPPVHSFRRPGRQPQPADFQRAPRALISFVHGQRSLTEWVRCCAANRHPKLHQGRSGQDQRLRANRAGDRPQLGAPAGALLPGRCGCGGPARASGLLMQPHPRADLWFWALEGGEWRIETVARPESAVWCGCAKVRPNPPAPNGRWNQKGLR